MDFSPEEERSGIHSAVNLHTKRIITAYYTIIESSQLEYGRDCLIRTDIDNFQLKMHNDSLMHSCRMLHTISSDLVLNSLLHSSDPDLMQRYHEETIVADTLSNLRKEIDEFDSSLSLNFFGSKQICKN
ncbi:uncharacterized protein BBOV_IV001850 [Babesia bovis T2Bo]|uniref:uncharacterized protein n=1 Tax=Babesia bovis T2Bo TaxID=484906 RepID=UPI001DD9F624|nr:uncharacterized protein BBOV_IV001850 [Babesia bovis T2Bo]EDO05782.2 hypothetical protein BBOV_IV001850 [Babesia bovis T2Bo]